MKKYCDLHPLSLLIYTLFTAVCAMLTHNLYLLSALLFCGIITQLLVSDSIYKSLRFDFILFLLCSLINPIFSHNGITPLFFINDNAITLESLIYGCMSGMAILCVLTVFSTFSKVMTSDKMLALSGKILPKTTAVLSAAITFIPRFLRDLQDTVSLMKTQGQATSDNYFGKIKSYVTAFANSMSRTLENSLITADSMKARGFGMRQNRRRKKYFFTAVDFIFITVSAITLLAVILTEFCGVTHTEFYPSFTQNFSLYGYITLILLAINGLLPLFITVSENIKWNFYTRKI